MITVNAYGDHKTVHWNAGGRGHSTLALIGEEPLSIRVQGKPYTVVMRTPGDEIAHVAGFCLSEGIVDSPEDIGALGFCDGSDTNVVTVTLVESRLEKIPEHLERRTYISQTSCGLCGKELVEELHLAIQPVPDGETTTDVNKALECLGTLSQQQPIREQTRASHAAVVLGAEYKTLSFAEDVGRHNALDKAIGKIFLDGTIKDAAILVLSSRISYELVQKAARARIPIVLAKSRPTKLAVELAARLNMTLACPDKRGGLFVFCGGQRIIEPA